MNSQHRKVSANNAFQKSRSSIGGSARTEYRQDSPGRNSPRACGKAVSTASATIAAPVGGDRAARDQSVDRCACRRRANVHGSADTTIANVAFPPRSPASTASWSSPRSDVRAPFSSC